MLYFCFVFFYSRNLTPRAPNFLPGIKATLFTESLLKYLVPSEKHYYLLFCVLRLTRLIFISSFLFLFPQPYVPFTPRMVQWQRLDSSTFQSTIYALWQIFFQPGTWSTERHLPGVCTSLLGQLLFSLPFLSSCGSSR